MIAHHHPGMNPPTRLFARLIQGFHPHPSIPLIGVDPPTLVAASHDVVRGTGVFDSNSASHWCLSCCMADFLSTPFSCIPGPTPFRPRYDPVSEIRCIWSTLYQSLARKTAPSECGNVTSRYGRVQVLTTALLCAEGSASVSQSPSPRTPKARLQPALRCGAPGSDRLNSPGSRVSLHRRPPPTQTRRRKIHHFAP
jgi:hypothetical protein